VKTLRLARWKSISTAAALVLAILAGPDTAGAGASNNPPGGTFEGRWKASASDETSRPASFSFHRQELGAGRISVQLGEPGKRYVGQYLRLTGSRPLSRIRIFYTYWVSDDFDDFHVGPTGAPLKRRAVTLEQFQRRYAGSVVATMIGEEGGSMRCVFSLIDPDGGLAGGASGRCQISDGGVVDVVQNARR